MRSRADLGRLAEAMNGLPVWGCLPGSAAARAGLRYGDILLAIDGVPTPSADAYYAARTAAREIMTLLVFRDGVEIAIELSLRDDPDAPPLRDLARRLIDERLLPTLKPPKPSTE